jgi:hypothetical protein
LALLPTPAKQEKKKNVFCAVFWKKKWLAYQK